MKKIFALLGSLLMVVTLATPAATATKYTVNQKTLSAFSSSATGLTSQQMAQVKAAIEANPNAEKFICTGIRYVSQPMSENIKVRARAKAACEYAKQLNPNLSTWFQNKPTEARSYAGKVLLTIKSPEQGEIEFQEPNPFDEPFPTSFNEQQFERALIANLDRYFLEVRRVPSEPVRLFFGDNFRLETREKVQRYADKAASFLFPLLEGESKLAFLIAQDDEELGELLSAAGFDIPISRFCGWPAPPNCIEWGSTGLWPSLNDPNNLERLTDAETTTYLSVMPHEWFHQVQAKDLTYKLGNRIPSRIGAWWTEGSATMVQRYVTRTLFLELSPNAIIGMFEGCTDSGRTLEQHVYHDMSAYETGALASSYLVASLGFEVVIRFFEEARTDQDWEDVFRRATGFSLDHFYERFELARKNVEMKECS